MVDTNPTDGEHAQVRAIDEALEQDEKGLGFLYDLGR